MKLDGYRALAIKNNGRLGLRSRNNNDFNGRYPAIVKALAHLPDNTVIDGEIVALVDGRPSFNALQNYNSSAVTLVYYVFDILIFAAIDVMSLPLSARRGLLREHILPHLSEPVRESRQFEVGLSDLIASARAQRLEGLVAKRTDSHYEPGQRSGAWRKMRINRGQEFVIGGYTVASKTFDALVIGYYNESGLMYAARTRNGFTPSSREEVYRRFRGLEITDCPFVNLPEKMPGRWGQGLTAAKLSDCRWLRPVLVGQFHFVEWTPDAHLRHSSFVSLRDDKDARQVRHEAV